MKTKQIRKAADTLCKDYESDEELIEFTALDGDDFRETIIKKEKRR